MNGNKNLTYLGVLSVVAVAGLSSCDKLPFKSVDADGAEANEPTREKALPFDNRDYSFGYWKNGMRKHRDDSSADVLSIETGYFGLEVDVAKLQDAKFGFFNDSLDYNEALAADGKRMELLKPAELLVELEHEGNVYRAFTSRAAREREQGKRFQSTRMWESARLAQYFDIQKLEFKDAEGKALGVDATLNIQTWPDSLAISAELEPAIDYKTGPEEGIVGNGLCVSEKSIEIPHEAGMENETFTFEAWIKIPERKFNSSNGWILAKNHHESFDGNFGFMFGHMQATAVMNIGGKANRHYLRSGGHSVLPDKWHHYALSYDGETMRFFLDGRERQSKKIGRPRKTSNGVMRIGQRPDGHGAINEVVVDQIRMWNRVLPVNELRQHTHHPGKLSNRNGLTYENNFEDGSKIERPAWKNATMRVALKTEGNDWKTEHLVEGDWKVGETQKLILNCDWEKKDYSDVKVTTSMKLNELPAVEFRKDYGCFVSLVNRPKRDFKKGYTDIRAYDELDIVVQASSKKNVPFMMEMFDPANVTGVCPILCDEHGVPTGIPVQLSKNWHEAHMGPYSRFYVLLPASAEEKKYKLRMPYGFYGTLPTTHHAQLSLVGYGGNGRWDQLGIGCWGETYCMDMDMSCVDVVVTDVRMLMARDGKEGKKWGWTDAGWGGDWLGLKDGKGQKHLFNGLKTAYIAHGPCLTEVHYDGYYGAERQVDVASTVRTLRTDDHARTFTTMKYVFDKPVDAKGWLFKMGRTSGYITPKIAYGNVDGLIKEHDVPEGLKLNEEFVKPTTLQGEGPWWVSFPGAHSKLRKEWGTGYRALVIRSYKAVIGGKEYTNPTVSFPMFRWSEGQKPNLDCLLTAPEGVTEFQPGDSVEFDVQWITLPRQADDYYGPNESFRKHVTENPASWVTTHREAVKNNLKVDVSGGSLLHSYPVIVKANQQDEIVVDIQGGTGYVPIRFEGLHEGSGYSLYQVVDGKEVKLDQSAHGNDFWQTDYDTKSNSFKFSYNLPLDDVASSKWVLRRDQ
ncbi:LamG domain-containing protein [Rubritalea marina]|uniref:LamG domain-containing protein n=1 Tax=Rubritalea marina TaxID=361055 RepID=UPI001461443E|nr:LamG domain-containing protein [Rubritalea marina]